MAVDRREKDSDAKFMTALGGRTDLTNREPELADVVEDLRDDVNALSTLSADSELKLGGMIIQFVPPAGRTGAKVILKTVFNGKTLAATIPMK